MMGFHSRPDVLDLGIALGEHENRLEVSENEPFVAYQQLILTFKHAKMLMQKWHNRAFGEVTVDCQIEVCSPN